MEKQINKDAAVERSMLAAFNYLVIGLKESLEDMSMSDTEKLRNLSFMREWFENEGKADEAAYIDMVFDCIANKRPDHKLTSLNMMMEWLVQHEKYEACPYVKYLIGKCSGGGTIDVEAKIVG